MARKQFVETPRQIVERVLRDTQVLIDMSEIEQDERLQAQGVTLHQCVAPRLQEGWMDEGVVDQVPGNPPVPLSEYIKVSGGSVRREDQERRTRQRGEFSLNR